MAEDEEQLEFDFTEYDDGAEKEAHETREALNFSAVQAIEEAPEILERFEKLSLLNAFQVNGKIAKCEGQSSFVFCATDCATDKKVVLKCLDPLFTGGNEGLSDIDYEKLFEWEDKILELLKQNRHSVNKIKKLSRAPVKIKSGGEIFLHKVSYFAAENLGVELKKAFLDKKNSSFSKKSNLLRLFCQILTAVYSIHRAGVFHRDLKPSNLMARSGKKSDGVVLIDFASSSVKVELINKIMMFPQKWHGTADYAAPEISCGLGPEEELAAAQDMYSLGCMLYELFSYDTFAQRLSALNPRYIETMENCRIYSNDGETLEERLEAYGLYLDSFALFKRTGLWAKTALILNPSSKQGADFFFKTLFKAETDFFTRFMEKFVTFSSTKKDAVYYADSMNILGNCYFEKEKYSECLSVLQELCSGEHFSAGIWSNISLCNSKMEKADRALKNSAKAYARLKSGDSSALRTNVSSIYMELLYKAKDFDGAIKVFSAEFGASFVPRTRKEYLQISDIYLNSLLEKREFGGYAGYLDFMWQCVKGAGGDDADEVKVCILNAKVRLFADIAPSGKILSECAAEYEKLFYAYRKKNKNLPLFFNNLVYSAIESGEKLENETLNLFISNAVQNCYLCATFGLYQARVKHNAEKCEYYYNKAATLILKDDFESRATLLDELKLKRDSELMRLAEQAGDTREAERLRSRILKKCPSELWFYARRAEEKQREENS